MSRRTNFRNSIRRTTRTSNRANHSLYRRPLRLEPLEDRRLLALVTVTTPLDTIDFGDGMTSLREAIFATNIVPGADTIDFDFGHDDPATILLTQGELKITDSLTIQGTGAGLLTIDASGNDPTPDANDNQGSRIFYIDDGDFSPLSLIDVSLSGLSLTGGDLKISPPNPSLPNGLGGAIASSERLTLSEMSIFGNYADRGGGVGVFGGTLAVVSSDISNNSASVGGGIYATATGGELRVEASTVSANAATGDFGLDGGVGGGIYSNIAINLIESRLTDNFAAFRGSAIYTPAGVMLGQSVVSGNTTAITVRQGASTLYANGDVSLVETTVRNNAGHGIVGRNVTLSNSNVTGNSGAGISARYVVTIDRSDVSHNNAVGVSTRDGKVTIHDSTIAGNGSAGIFAGIYSSAAVVVVATSIFDNAAGIITTGDVTLLRSSVTGNVNNSFFSAGIFARGNVTLNESTVSGNSALGIYTRGAGVYGGRSVTLNQSTVSGNTSYARGGGIASYGNIAIRYSTVANNAAGLTGGGIHSGNPQYHDLRIEFDFCTLGGHADRVFQ